MDVISAGEHWPALLVGTVVVLVLVALVLNLYSAEKLFIGALVVLLVAGILPAEDLLLGFSNPGIFTIAALFVVVGGLRESGATQVLRRYLVGSPKNLTAAQLRILPVTTVLSAVVNNTPVVAMFVTLLQNQSKRFNISLSSILLPVSFASILGGTCTLIGTSTNLVVDGMLQQSGYKGFGLFDIALVGVPVALVGLLYIFLFGRWLLPEREGSAQQFDQVREYLVEMIIQPGSELVRKSIQDAGLRNLPGLFLVEIERAGQVISAVRPRTVMEADDRLIFAGSPESVLELRNIHGLVLANDQRFKLDGNRSDRRLFEAVLSPSNPMVGQTIRESRFRHRYSAVVLSVSRHGQRLRGKLGELVLREGDTLLVEAQKGFLMRHRNSNDFLLVSKLGNPAITDESKAWIALAAFIGMLLASGFGLLSILESSAIAAVIMLATKCISYEEAGRSIDFTVLTVVACAFGVGKAVSSVGLADGVAALVLDAVSTPFAVMVAIYLVTVMLTEMMTNNAAAIVMLPIALSASESLQVSYEPFAIAIMIAASASFMTPTGYQTNLMVMGPGGYKFTDYFKFGAPLSVIVALLSWAIIPEVWPFGIGS